MFKTKFDYKKLNQEFATFCLIGDLDKVKSIFNEHEYNPSIFNSFLNIVNIVTSFNPNHKNSQALANACLMGKTNIVEYLLEQEKFKKNLTNSAIQVSLQIAISSGSLEIVKMLLPLNKKSLGLYIAVELGYKKACYLGHLDTVKYLTLDKDLNFNQLEQTYGSQSKAPFKYSGFLNAGAGGQLEVIKFLSESPEMQNQFNFNMLNNPGVKVKMEVNSLEVMNYFIFNLKLKRNDPLIQGMIINPKIAKDVDLLFQKQELFKDLNVDFENNIEEKTAKKRPKL